MKLLFIAPSAYLLGGVQDWLYMLTLGLRDRGHIVDVAIPNNRFHDGSQYNKYYKDMCAIFFSNRSGTAEGRIRALSKLMISRSTDLIVGVNIGDLFQAYKRTHKQLANVKLAMTLHAIEGDYLGDIGRYHNLIDGVITTNRLTEEIVVQLRLIETGRVFYAPYGVDFTYSGYSQINDRSLKILWVGRIDDGQKRVSDLYEILANLDSRRIDYVLSIAGDGPDRNKLESKLSLWVKNGKVRFLGFLKKSELQYEYKNHNTLLITSKWETGPIVAWEAMSAGLAVVSSEYIGYASEKALINDDTALLYPIGSGQMAAYQLSRLCNPKLREKLSLAGQQMVKSRYSSSTCLNRWEEVFRQIINSRWRPIPKTAESSTRSAPQYIRSILDDHIKENLRVLLRRKSYCLDAGSEWPHSLYGPSNQSNLLKYAETLEENA